MKKKSLILWKIHGITSGIVPSVLRVPTIDLSDGWPWFWPWHSYFEFWPWLTRLYLSLVGGLEHGFYVSIYWEKYSQLTVIFFRGVAQPPTRSEFEWKSEEREWMSLEEGDEGATFGAGLQQPNFAPGQCFLLARMSYIMVWSIGMVTIYCNPIWEAMLKQVLRSGSTSPSSWSTSPEDTSEKRRLAPAFFKFFMIPNAPSLVCILEKFNGGNSWFFEMSLWKWNIQPEGGVGFKNSFNRNLEGNCRIWWQNSKTFLKP